MSADTGAREPRRFIDTGKAIHLPQTDRLRGRKQASSVHGYRGDVLTWAETLASDAPLCDRCFPANPPTDPPSSIGGRAERMGATE